MVISVIKSLFSSNIIFIKSLENWFFKVIAYM